MSDTFSNAALFAVALMLCATGAQAQDVFLAPANAGAGPGAWTAAPGETVRLRIEGPAGPGGARASAVRDAEGDAGALSLDRAGTDSALSFVARAPGVAAGAVTLADEAGATVYAKTFVCVAPCQDMSATFTPFGAPLELVELPSGPPFARRFELLVDGTPLPGAELRLTDAEGGERSLASDIEGGISISDLPEGPVRLAASRTTKQGVVTATLSFLWTEWTPGRP